MPNIPTFEAGIEGLTPSDRGSTAMREAAVVQVRTANVAAEATRRAGQTIGSGLQSLGSALGGIEEKAQAHTDAMAEIDFQNNLTASEIGAFGGISTASTPTDSDGQPIHDHVGAGGERSLSPDDNVPNPGQFAQVASNVTQRHAGILGGLLDAMPSFGASQKAQDRMAAQAAASQRRLAVHAAAEDAKLQVTHAVHSVEQQVNESIAAVGRGQVPLSDGLAQLDETFDSASRLGWGKAGAALSEHVEKMRTVGRFNMIKESMEADVNKGQFAKAMQKLDSKTYDAELGGKREELRTHLNGLNNQVSAAQDRADRREDAQKQSDRHDFVGDLYERTQLAPNDPNYVKDPMDVINKKYKGDDKIDARDVLQKLTNGPTIKETNISRETFSDLGRRINLPAGDPNKITDITELQEARIKSPGSPGSLNAAHYKELEGMVLQQKTPDGDRLNVETEKFMKSREAQIDKSNPLMGKIDETGKGNFYDWSVAVRAKERELLKAGRDPRLAITPGNPDYMGSPDNMKNYQRTIQQSIQEMQRKITPPAATTTPTTPQAPEQRPIMAPQNVTPDEIRADPKKYPPNKDGSIGPVILPDGRKKMIPATEKMSFAPTNETAPKTAAQDAISSALRPASLGPPGSSNFTPNPESQAPSRMASVRNNNPGAQWPNRLAKDYGATGHQNLSDGNKIATFPTPIHGAAANMALLEHKYVGNTIASIQKTWSGQHRGSLPGYPGSTVVTTEMANDPKFMVPFMKAMADAEAPRGSTVMSDAQWRQAFDLYQETENRKSQMVGP